jgi:EAL domain-containing protein (putative c-di-GMP-specific phosphodiesterase class I)/CheY-like chemotaxis protein
MLGPSHLFFTAASGDEALAIVAAEEIDLVISDIYMAGISGPDLARRVLTASPETVLVMMSGVDRIECAIAAMRAGAFDYIQKPLDPVIVEATVRRALDRRAAARAGNKGALPRRPSLENGLRTAFERMDFEVHYQPQVDASTGRIVGAEALLRWPAAREQGVTQEAFIQTAEESGLIVPIGEWVLRTASREASSWQTRGIGLPAETLEMELTESSVLDDPRSFAALAGLKSLGVGLALDDFGTGYSSLACLKRFSFDRLKIDRSFISDLVTSSESAALVGSIIRLAHSVELEVVAEGIESADQLELLRGMGCDAWQGYLCSPALPSAQFAALLRSRSVVAA